MDDVAQQVGIRSQNPISLINLIKKNRLMQFLSAQGYKTIAIQTGFPSTELVDADYYLSQNISLTGYQLDLINLTPFSILIRNYPYEIHRIRTRFVFNQLPPQIQINHPIFVFAHIFAPHPPFVFNKNGDENNPDMIYSPNDGDHITDISGKDIYIQQYRDQLIYINYKLVESIEKILAIPGRESIIIVQGDHGPGSMLDHASFENSNIQERMSILNAYYFPDGDYSKLYPEITPVNTFRVVLDQYLGTNLGLLEDRSYFSLYTSPYDLIDVTDELMK